MTKSSSHHAKISEQSEAHKRGLCCSGKKFVSYRCKVRCMATVCILLIGAAAALLYFLLTKKGLAVPENVLSLPKRLNWKPNCPSPKLKIEERFDCYPEVPRVTKAACEDRGCCYIGHPTGEGNDTLGKDEDVPICVYPINYGYESAGKARAIFNGFEVPLQRIPAPSRYGDDIHIVYMRVEMQTKYRLRIKFYDPENSRYEVPAPKIPVHAPASVAEQNTREVFLYSVTYNTVSSPFAVKVRRSSTDAVIFDTSVGALTLANQFLELSTRLPSSKFYALGQQTSKPYHHASNFQRVSLFSSIAKNNSYASGVHPMYLCVEDDGSSHGVLLLNSNAMEIQFHPSSSITFRTIGGILDFYLFLGPSPEAVIEQYTEAIGRSLIPPYWSLGFQIGQPVYSSVSEIEKFIDGFKTRHIPVETFILNKDVVKNYISGTEEFRGLTNLTSKISSKSQKILITFEPTISTDDIMNRNSIFNFGQENALISDKWGLHPIVGMKVDKKVVFPDFGSASTMPWWAMVVNKIFSSFDFGGLWLVNNLPKSDIDGSVNGCLSDDLNRPPFVPSSFVENTLYHNTLCMDALLHWKDEVVIHYDCHNSYGHFSAIATENAFSSKYPEKRKLILTDSTFIGSGQYAGHFIKQLDSGWSGLRASIPTVMELGQHGIAFSGVNICGPFNTENIKEKEELCLRWYQLGIFYPLMQVHGMNAKVLHNSEAFSSEFSHAVRNAISRRYELLPYLYSLFYLAHTKGSTVMRPLFHEFPLDNETYSISSQFLWGPSLLISPILEQGASELNFYLPNGVWYDYYQGMSIYSNGRWFSETGGPFIDIKQPAVMHIRGGHIITLQKPSETITTSRQNSMTLLVALNSTFQAYGFLYWDDGETKNSLVLGEYIIVDFSANKTSIVVNGKVGKNVFVSNFYRAVIQQVRIMGLPKAPKRIVIDGSYILSNKQYRWNVDFDVLDLKHILIPLGRRTEIQWVF